MIALLTVTVQSRGSCHHLAGICCPSFVSTPRLPVFYCLSRPQTSAWWAAALLAAHPRSLATHGLQGAERRAAHCSKQHAGHLRLVILPHCIGPAVWHGRGQSRCLLRGTCWCRVQPLQGTPWAPQPSIQVLSYSVLALTNTPVQGAALCAAHPGYTGHLGHCPALCTWLQQAPRGHAHAGSPGSWAGPACAGCVQAGEVH